MSIKHEGYAAVSTIPLKIKESRKKPRTVCKKVRLTAGHLQELRPSYRHGTIHLAGVQSDPGNVTPECVLQPCPGQAMLPWAQGTFTVSLGFLILRCNYFLPSRESLACWAEANEMVCMEKLWKL